MKPMELQVQKLWKQRFERYAKEAIGYWQYAARSNFIGFLLFLVIFSSYYYAKTLQQLPTDYPYLWIVLLVLVPLLVNSPIRTLVRDPDRMFLLRAELQMGTYFRSAYTYSLTIQSFYILIAFCIVVPLYRHCEGEQAQPFLLLLLVLLIIKAINLQASWQESRLVNGRARGWLVVFRWCWTLVIAWLLFDKNVLWASSSLILASLLWLLLTRGLAAYPIGWDYLIAKEKTQQARLYAFFNGFVDVPHMPTQIRRRNWISSITRWLPFKQNNTYLYLYMKTMIRTELFGIVQRITVIGILAIVSMGSDATSAVIFLVVVLITTIQLSALGQAHQYTFWLSTYPLDTHRKASALVWNIWGALMAQTCLLAIALLIKAPIGYILIPLLSIGLCSFICGIILRRKFQSTK
ncbi:Bacterial ABC transporter protein EcsB [compost metagenome]